MFRVQGNYSKKFLSTPSVRRATIVLTGIRHHKFISIHALREEGDNNLSTAIISTSTFLSTPSVRRATHNSKFQWIFTSISIHALREEGDYRAMKYNLKECYISIHALREEGDKTRAAASAKAHKISIHALREEGDAVRFDRTMIPAGFLSTPSVRRATRER